MNWLPESLLHGNQGKGHRLVLSPLNSIFREPYVKRLSRHILPVGSAVCSVFHGSPDNGSTPGLIRLLFLKFPDGLLAKEDEQLPLARHVFRPFQDVNFIQDAVVGVLVRAQEVIVCDP